MKRIHDLAMLGREKKHGVVLLRWVLVIALSYLLLFAGRSTLEPAPLGWIAVFLASNILLMRLPAAAFHHKAFDLVLMGVDTALITLALWTSDEAGADFFFLFFFVVVLPSAAESAEFAAVRAVLAITSYLCFLHRGPVWEPAILLRVPFFLVTALTYGYLAATARRAGVRAQAAEEALVLKKRFLSTMSHEFRTPLNVIVGYSEMLRDGLDGDLTAEQRSYLGKITAQAFEMLRLIDRTLTAARLESGSVPLQVEEVRMQDILEDVRQGVQPYARNGVRLTLHSETGMPPLRTDGRKLSAVLTDLVTNALKHTPEGAVSVDARCPGNDGFVELVVEDTGGGIAPDARADIFEMFTRSATADSECTPGIGLGLYLAHRLLTILKGELRVRSEPGRGSTFTVRLPQKLEDSANAA